MSLTMCHKIFYVASAVLFSLPFGCDGGGSGEQPGDGQGGGQGGGAGLPISDVVPNPRFGMVVIPPGPFMMGCNETVDARCRDDESPQRQVYLNGYLIDVREITNDEYAKFLNEHGNECTIVPCHTFDDEQSQITLQNVSGNTIWAPVQGKASFPAAEITWYGARAYCEWANKRLCTEAEWEKAARGGCELYQDCAIETPVYPWGNTKWSCDKAVGKGCGIGTTQLPGTKQAGQSLYGVFDMAGNVWEWTADIYYAEYYTKAPSANPLGADLGDFRVVRGGSYLSTDALRSSYRGDFAFPYLSASTVGFRCCADE